MSKAPSARDLLRKAREQKKLEQQSRRKIDTETQLLPSKRQRSADNYEDQTSTGVSRLKIAEQKNLDTNDSGKRQKTEKDAGMPMLVKYDSESDEEDEADADVNRSSETSRKSPQTSTVELSNGLPTGFFDQGIEPSNDLDSMSEDDDDENRNNRQEKEIATKDKSPPNRVVPAETLSLEQELAQFESEILELEKESAVKTVEDDIAETGTR
ncbi:hypothetical protein IW150_002483, partial [Coemansia sp. RSA 2607]